MANDSEEKQEENQKLNNHLGFNNPLRANRTMADYFCYMEGVLIQRFNFLLVFFSIIAVGSVSTSDPVYFKIILVIGTIFCFLISLTIIRVQYKVNLALCYLREIEGEPSKLINNECKRKNFPIPSMTNMVGYWIPTLCWIVLLQATILAFLGILKAPAM